MAPPKVPVEFDDLPHRIAMANALRWLRELAALHGAPESAGRTEAAIEECFARREHRGRGQSAASPMMSASVSPTQSTGSPTPTSPDHSPPWLYSSFITISSA